MKKLLTLIAFLTIHHSLFGQVYTSVACPKYTSSDLGKSLYSSEPFHISTPWPDHENELFPMFSQSCTTSVLQAPGAAPPIHPGCRTKPSPNGPELLDPKACREVDYDQERVIQYDLWSCTYAPSKVWDGNIATAWSEGVPGPGIGEVLIIPLDPRNGFRIRTGIAASKKLFLSNNRPARVRFHLIKVDRVLMADPFPYLELTVIGDFDHTLVDRNAWQSVRTPWAKYEPQPSERAFPDHVLAIEIRSVYLGTIYDDTAISEIDMLPP